MLSFISATTPLFVFCKSIIASGKYEIGELFCDKDPDRRYKVGKNESLSKDPKYYTFENLNLSLNLDLDDLIWLKKTRIYPNPNPKPSGFFWSLIRDIYYKAELSEDLLVASICTISEDRIVEIRIFGREFDEELKDYFSSLDCFRKSNVVYLPKPKCKIEF